jgi:xanthine dehydrogenase small subunit
MGVRFLLDSEIIEPGEVDPTTTVLQFLRRQLRRTGTKEGCAEGDCGACTVAIGDLDGETIRYRAVNACIAFLPMLDGRELVTVESLAGDDLHPAQQAMVDCHGSQCGFCTPGFVMSLFVHQECGAATDDQTLCDALAGNLCRCTGYGPILAAARRMKELPPRPRRGRDRRALAALKAIRRTSDLTLRHFSGGLETRYHAPRTLDSLLALKAQNPQAILVAGGTDVGLWATKQRRTLSLLIGLHEVKDLSRVEQREDGLVIGAAATYADAHAALRRWHPDLGEIIRRIGSTQIRNSGTIGGNIANGSPIGDTMPVLIAAGAQLLLRSVRGARRMQLDEFYVAPLKQDRSSDEIVEAVFLPRLQREVYFRAYKVSKRFDQDISALLGAFALTLIDGRVASARIAFGGMAATPRRAYKCEAALTGLAWTRESIEKGMAALDADFTPISDMRASATYRRQVAGNLLVKAFLEHQGAAARVLEAAGG